MCHSCVNGCPQRVLVSPSSCLPCDICESWERHSRLASIEVQTETSPPAKWPQTPEDKRSHHSPNSSTHLRVPHTDSNRNCPPPPPTAPTAQTELETFAALRRPGQCRATLVALAPHLVPLPAESAARVIPSPSGPGGSGSGGRESILSGAATGVHVLAPLATAAPTVPQRCRIPAAYDR